jgi:hypothetical protein
MRTVIVYCTAVASLTLSGCASDHDLKRNPVNFFGGGYIDQPVAPGIYQIKAFSSNLVMATSDAAARTFENRARSLCPAGFSEVRAVVASRNSGVGRPNDDVKSKIGYVRCNDSPLSLREAQALVAPE